MSDKARNATTRVMSGDEFRRWRNSKGLTLRDLGRDLGLSRQAIHYLDEHGLTRVQALALAALEAELDPISPVKEVR